MLSDFAKRYFFSAAGAVSAGFLCVGVVMAWISAACGEWWKAYLQGMSTTIIGLAIGLLFLQFLLDLQREQLTDRLRRDRELILASSLGRLLPNLERWLPQRGLPPATVQIEQLIWARGRVERIRESGLTIAPEIHTAEQRKVMEALAEGAGNLSDSLERLINLLSRGSEESDLVTCLDGVWTEKEQFAEVASGIYEQILKPPDDLSIEPHYFQRIKPNVLPSNPAGK